MRIIYDARMLSFPYTGLGRFSGELLMGLLRLALENSNQFVIIMWSSGKIADIYEDQISFYEGLGVCSRIYVKCKPVGITQHWKLRRYLNINFGDVYLHPHFDMPIFRKIPTVCFIHDLFPTLVPGYIVNNYFIKVIYFKLMLRIVAEKAKFIFAVSKTTKNDYLNEVGIRYSNKVGVSLEGPIIRKDIKHIFKKMHNNNFILYAGDRRPHKNIKKIIDIYIELKNNSYLGDLLLVGSTKNYDFNVESYISGIDGIHVLGQVSDECLLNLYLQMDALVFLSKYEGFGLPVAEAGLLGKKIIVSDGGALNEISPKWAYKLCLNAEIKEEAIKILEYLRSIPEIDKNYGSDYKWDSVARRVNKKLKVITGLSYGK
jgi:glycosyltransferase involved in cell wall biosynthesis